MMHVCIVYNQQMQEMDLSAGAEEVFTLLSQWHPLSVQQGILMLPEGWMALRQGKAMSNIPLCREANYPLQNGRETALLMLRHGGAEKVRSVELLTVVRFSIGRSRSNELCYRDGYLSSFHGVFFYDREGVLWYADKSTNGTYVNGVLLHNDQRRVETGDQLCFPPMMSVTLNGCALHIRCPLEHTQLKLPRCSSENSKMTAALYVQPMGKLYHLSLGKETNTLRAFLACAMEQVDKDARSYLERPVVLAEPLSKTIISDDAKLVDVLKKHAPVILVM